MHSAPRALNHFTKWLCVTFCFLIFNFLFLTCSAQAYINLGATPTYVNISGGTIGTPIYLIVGNISRTAGWITSEGQYNYVNWKNTGIASYTIPFGYTGVTDYLPFTFNKTAGAAADLLVSTWGTPNTNVPWANTTNAAAVANMANPSFADASIPDVIDRWWTINSAGATASLSFTYRGQENTMAAPANVLAIQHWNGTMWNNGSGGGNGSYINTSTAGLQGVVPHTVSSGSTTFTQFSPYILVDVTAPLPIEWLNVSAECERGDITIKWSTATEQNSDYFTVERSLDGFDFSSIATDTAAHNSSTVQNYSAADNDAYSETSYYRIKETDFNGAYIYSGIIAVNGCAGDDIFIYGYDRSIHVNINAAQEDEYKIELYNMLGQKITTQLATVTAGNNRIKLFPNTIASAIYVVKIFNNANTIIKQVFIHSTVQ